MELADALVVGIGDLWFQIEFGPCKVPSYYYFCWCAEMAAGH